MEILIVTVAVAVIIFLAMRRMRQLERRYLEKERLIGDQMAAVNRLVEQLDSIRVRLSTEQIELDRKAEVFAELILKAKPFVESLEKVY